MLKKSSVFVGAMEDLVPNTSGEVISPERSREVNEAADNVMFQTVIFQGFIMEFSLPEVRTAFLFGNMTLLRPGENMLKSLDAIRDMMLPTLRTGAHGLLRDQYAIAGVKFFNGLLDKSEENPLDVHGDPLPVSMTFKEWFDFFGEVSSSPFWKTAHRAQQIVRPKIPRVVQDEHQDSDADVVPQPRSSSLKIEGKAHSLAAACGLKNWSAAMGEKDISSRKPGLEKRNPSMDKNQILVKHQREVNVADVGSSGLSKRVNCDTRRTRLSDSVEEKFADLHVRKNTRQKSLRRKQQEEDSTSTSDSGSSTTDSSSEDSNDDQRNNDRKLLKILKTFNRPRDAVPPEMFSGQGDISFKAFLREYENYFSAKFDGNNRQKARQLGKFLSSGVRRAYDAMDGSKMKYREVKEKLLSWYNVERVSSRRQAEADFDCVRKQVEDTHTIYTLRLERLAKKAFPNSQKDRERQLCRKLWKTAPKPLVKAMEEAQRSLALLSNHKQISWDSMKRIAENEDRRAKMHQPSSEEDQSTPRTYRFEYDNEEAVAAVWEPERPPSSPTQRKFPTTYYNRQRAQASRSPPAGSRVQRPVCCWCGRAGHMEESCWEKEGKCLICGSALHTKDECPRFQVPSSDLKVTCSSCGGPHLGKHCDASKKLNL